MGTPWKRAVRIWTALVVTLAMCCMLTHCGDSAIPVPPIETPAPIVLNVLDGGSGIPVDSTFKYEFSRPIRIPTVTPETFFVLKTPDSFDPATVCDIASALPSTVECTSNTECVLTPTDPLEYETRYTACLTQDIWYEDGIRFEGAIVTFTTEAPGPLDLKTLDGATDVPVTSTFRYRFLYEIEPASVGPSSFFIVPVSSTSASVLRAVVDPAICRPGDAIGADISCTPWSCTITPWENLVFLTRYAACLTTDIWYAAAPPVAAKGLAYEIQFNGFMAGFQTEVSPVTPTVVTITSVKLVRMDGAALDLTARPIPRMVNIVYTIDPALPSESDREAFENSVTLVDEAGAEIEGTYAWSSDFRTATFMPAFKLDYQSEYTIEVNEGGLPAMDISRAVGDYTMSFVTMTQRDVTGDGLPDVLVGSNGYPGGVYRGRAYLIAGGPNMSDCDLGGLPPCQPPLTITGEADGDAFGINNAVDIVGDLNADGYEDMVVGARYYPSGLDQGRTYIFYGGADLYGSMVAAEADAIISGEADGDYFGAVIAAGDVNADGYDDVIIGANWAAGGWPLARGKAYLFLGGISLVGNVDVDRAQAIFIGAEAGDALGFYGCGRGNFNGDEYDDIVLAADHAAAGGINRGRAYVFLGGPSIAGTIDTSSAQASFVGIENRGYLGWPSEVAGDLNDDGYDDLIIGAPGSDTYRGKAYVFLGGPTLAGEKTLAEAYSVISGIDPDDYFPLDAKKLGDMNGDGFDDVLLGAALPATNWNGANYVFFGGPVPGRIGAGGSFDRNDADFAVIGRDDWDSLGMVIQAVGDVNGDGYMDMATSAPVAPFFSTKGEAYILFGRPTLIDCDLGGGCVIGDADHPGFTVTGQNPGDELGVE